MTAQLDHGHEDTQLAKLELRLHADHLTSARPMCSIGALDPGAHARRLGGPMQIPVSDLHGGFATEGVLSFVRASR